ncbi:GGDEF domain-containing protein [Salmonella enterica]|uniref:Probable diguanylate cyclase DgcQ n=3 Tax=Salmonella enterica subsp. salamae TaxID=59202 RepID=A0A447NTM4_SALER|nr:GGDEF domain-containing protein [Salmonella enterica]EAA5901424.1 GGDEF domain-containing protein [Salmonella enterica subsp. enterica]EBI0475834.1 GGDEF domain-containing protein [Salmonella enterica subsp. enterica serovar Braenderup]EBK2699433.1 GGDEF domain-containing protein [Salmonella enterica subsp. enterica serovar Paratyphi B]EDW0467048.1 GGDEF domain-containing protein [Salmonella enterica subsp. enterica serovar Victoria]EEJ9246523.1 GGDEF domain-containing protein [Salmonella e
MTTPSWRSLRIKKYQFSLRLFLFLNAVSALFTLVFPLYQINVFCTPMIGILVLSVLLLIWHGKYGQKRINLPFISILFGGLWAAHIALKYPALGHYDFSFLLISLLSVLFIGSIAFAANIVAFTLHSLPSVAVCLWLNGNEQGLRILYLLALPMVGIAIQHVIQKRYDNFAQQLMFTLLAERETLNGLSMLDPLTGLYNRRGLQNRLDTLQALGSYQHYVLLLDIDHFKAYNDHYGHMMGDQALIRVSAAIRDAVRSRDIVCRFGGEEFLVLLTAAEPQQARATAERIRQEVYDLKIPHMFNESVATNVTVSIGIAPLTDRNIGDAIEKADKALYEAKHLGRNHILVSDDVRAI